MTLKEELEQLYAEEEEIKAKICDAYRRSLEAEDAEKVFEDSWAEEMAEPETGFIKYPISIMGIENGSAKPLMRSLLNKGREGCLVSIRPCAEEYENKTFLGIYIGDIATTQMASYYEESGVLKISVGMHSPAIFVPDLKKVIFGYESWWGEIKSIDQIRKITDEDIENTWYAKLLSGLDNGG